MYSWNSLNEKKNRLVAMLINSTNYTNMLCFYIFIYLSIKYNHRIFGQFQKHAFITRLLGIIGKR